MIYEVFLANSSHFFCFLSHQLEENTTCETELFYHKSVLVLQGDVILEA